MKIEFLTGGEKRKRFLHEERERERDVLDLSVEITLQMTTSVEIRRK